MGEPWDGFHAIMKTWNRNVIEESISLIWPSKLRIRYAVRLQRLPNQLARETVSGIVHAGCRVATEIATGVFCRGARDLRRSHIGEREVDRKSTRLNSSHVSES